MDKPNCHCTMLVFMFVFQGFFWYSFWFDYRDFTALLGVSISKEVALYELMISQKRKNEVCLITHNTNDGVTDNEEEKTVVGLRPNYTPHPYKGGYIKWDLSHSN